MSLENTLFVIKPDGMNKRNEIIKVVKDTFEVIYSLQFRYSIEMIKEFYPTDINQEHFPALLELLTETESELNIIRGFNAITNFYQFAGTKTLPQDCSPNSLRALFAIGNSQTKSGLPIIKTAIHRCKSNDEYNKNIDIFRNYLLIPELIRFRN
ncbi:MAG: nucleoside-diphosphate kinase [bacterium]